MPHTEQVPNEQSDTLDRRDFLKAALAGVAAVALDSHPAAAQNSELDVYREADTENQYYTLRHQPIEFSTWRDDAPEFDQYFKALTTAAATLQNDASSEVDFIQAQQSLFQELAPLRPATASHAFDRNEHLLRLHELTKQLARRGYYFDYRLRTLVSKNSQHEDQLQETIFVPVRLQRITKIEQRQIDHFWDEASFAVPFVTIAPEPVIADGRPVVPRKFVSNDEANIEAMYRAIACQEGRLASDGKEFQDIQEGLRTDQQFAILSQLPAEAVRARMLAEPGKMPELAWDCFRVALQTELFKYSPNQLATEYQKLRMVHESSHCYLDQDPAYIHADQRRPTQPTYDERSFTMETLNRGVRAETGAILGELQFGRDHVSSQMPWLPMLSVVQEVSHRQQDKVHGAAAEWILREFVARVIREPETFHLDLSTVPANQREAAVWAQLGKLALEAPPEAMAAAWHDIAQTFRGSLKDPIVSMDGNVLTRALPAEKLTIEHHIHPSWGWVSAITTAIASAAFGAAKWRQRRMAEQQKKVTKQERSKGKGSKRKR